MHSLIEFSRCPRTRAGTRAAFEALEARLLLSAAPLAEPGIAIMVYRQGLVVDAIAPEADTDAARGTALRAALAAAVDGDQIILGPYTFDMGGQQHVEFPDRVTVRGAGKNLTRITSSCSQGEDPEATFRLNHLTVIEDLWLEGSRTDGRYQPLVGSQGPVHEDTAAYLRRVKITGDTDGIFIWTGKQYQYSVYGYDLEISTRYDAIAILGSGLNKQTVKLYNSTLTVTQPSSTNLHIANAVNAQSGFVGLYDSIVTVTGDANSVQTAGIWSWNQGTVEVIDCTFHVTSPAGFAYDFYIQNDRPVLVTGGAGTGAAGAYTSSTGSEQYVTPTPTAIVGREIYYHDSKFAAGGPLAAVGDFAAIAPDKDALLSGAGRATMANVTNYSRGINGLLIDLSGTHGGVSLDDFSFRVGANNLPATWAVAPEPESLVAWDVQGADDSTRLQLIWPSGAIKDQWLEVTLLANEDTGLSAPEVFYFGNKIGETSISESNAAIVNAADQIAVRSNTGAFIAIDSPYDFNRDRLVTAHDEIVSRYNPGLLLLIEPNADSLAEAQTELVPIRLPQARAARPAMALRPWAAATTCPEPNPATAIVHDAVMMFESFDDTWTADADEEAIDTALAIDMALSLDLLA